MLSKILKSHLLLRPFKIKAILKSKKLSVAIKIGKNIKIINFELKNFLNKFFILPKPIYEMKVSVLQRLSKRQWRVFEWTERGLV